jgi:hypothetical protein
MSLAMLTVTYPEFRISLEPHGWDGLRWAAVRTKGADPGLYAVITPDLGEPHAVLAAATISQSGESGQADSRKPGRPL